MSGPVPSRAADAFRWQTVRAFLQSLAAALDRHERIEIRFAPLEAADLLEADFPPQRPGRLTLNSRHFCCSCGGPSPAESRKAPLAGPACLNELIRLLSQAPDRDRLSR